MLLVLIPMLAANVLCGLDIYRLSSRRERIKEDYSEVNSIRYGLLSVDSWKDRVQSILGDRIGDFKLSKENEAVLRDEISQALNALITQADEMLQRRQKTFSGKMRRFAVRAFFSIREIRRQVPALCFGQSTTVSSVPSSSGRHLAGICTRRFSSTPCR